MTSILEQSATDDLAAQLAVHACAVADPADQEHDHDECLDAPGAALADHLWAIASAAATDDWKLARLRTRRLEQAIGAGELGGG